MVVNSDMNSKVLMVVPSNYHDENQNGIAKIIFNITAKIPNEIDVTEFYIDGHATKPSLSYRVSRFFEYFSFTKEEFNSRYYGMDAVREIKRISKEYDCIHFVSSGSCSLWSLLDSSVLKKSIFSLIDNKLVYQERKGKTGIINNYKSKIQMFRISRFYTKLVEAKRPIVFVSSFDSEHFSNIYCKKCDFDVLTIENGVSINGELPINKNKNGKLVFHGDFDYEPNILAANYIISFSKMYQELEFVLFGKSSERYNIKNVLGKGFIDNISSELRQGDIYFAPLTLGSGMKNKILEAMSFGMIIITTEIGNDGIGIENGINGYIVDLNKPDAIYELINNIKQGCVDVDSISRRAKVYIEENFSWKSKADAYCSLYEEVRNGS